MPEETITINLAPGSGNGAFFDELDRRFDALSQRFGGKLRQALSAGGGFGAPGSTTVGGRGGVAPGGGISAHGEGVGGSPSGPVGAVASSLASGAAQGIQSTPMGAVGLNAMTARNAGISALGVGAGLAGAAVGGAVAGPVGAAIGGSLALAEFNKFENAIRGPEENALNRIKSFYGDLARHGINVSDSDIERNLQRALEVERRGNASDRRVERIQGRQDPWSSVTWSLSQIF